MRRGEFLEEMIKRHGPDVLDAPMTLRALIESLEVLRVLEYTPDTYRPGELDVVCPLCGSVAGEECRASPKTGARLPSPHAERRELAEREKSDEVRREVR